jgi:methyltransferase
VPGLPLVTRGPYRLRWLRHPNYVAVAVEGAALPLVHGAWVTAVAFTLLNAVVMVARIRCEETALASLTRPPATGEAAA